MTAMSHVSSKQDKPELQCVPRASHLRPIIDPLAQIYTAYIPTCTLKARKSSATISIYAL